MNDETIIAMVKNKCKRSADNGQVTLWTADSLDDKLHIARLATIVRLFDLPVGGIAHIEGHLWRLQERKNPALPGVICELVRVNVARKDDPPVETADKFGTKDGMVVANRPKTPKEWAAWNIARMEAKGIPMAQAQPPQPVSNDFSMVDFSAMREAEG